MISESGRNGKEKKKRGQPGQGNSWQEGHWKGAGKGKGWGGQKAHDGGQKAHHGGLGDGVAKSSRALSEAVVAVLSASRGINKRVQALQPS